MSRITFLSLSVALAVSSVSCGEADPGPDCLQDCETCAAGECPLTHCGLRVVLSDTCSGRTGPLEVAVGQCVQDGVLTPGTTRQLCVALGLHDEIEVHGRSEEWVFEETVKCTNDEVGGTIVLTFDCGDADTDVIEGAD